MNPERFYMRNPAVAAISGRGAYHFTRPGETFTLRDVEMELLIPLMSRITAPIAGARLVEEFARSREQLEAVLEALVDNGVVLTGTEEELWKAAYGGALPEKPTKPCKHLVLCISGTIQAMNMPQVALRLFHGFAQRVDVVLTEKALKMVSPGAFEYLGLRVWTDEFQAQADTRVPHIELAGSTELVAVCPASARTLQRLASGECSDLTSLIATATRAPVVVFPAMNHAMWEHPAVQRNVAQLRGDGVYVVEPGLGFEVANRDTPLLEPGPAGYTPENMFGILSVVLQEARSRQS
jgi:phosphopantothenoylcysteine decarboxylase/phosphopantothenate--cysteine ligase